jgi:hypothetical protein
MPHTHLCQVFAPYIILAIFPVVSSPGYTMYIYYSRTSIYPIISAKMSPVVVDKFDERSPGFSHFRYDVWS